MPVDVNQALDLKYNRHLSYSEIAAIQGVTPQAVHSRIKDLLPLPEQQTYSKHKADILSNVQMRVLSYLDDAAMQKMMDKAPGAAALWFNSAFNAEQLERGRPTAIVDVRSMVMTVDAKIEELQAVLSRKVRLGEPEGGGGVE
jgi:predicted DNA-binding protein YlxM (UPF0122 family)